MSQTLPLAGSRSAITTKRVILWAALLAALASGLASLAFGTAGLAQTLDTGLSHVVMVTGKGGQLFNYNDTQSNAHIVSGHYSYATVVVTGLPGSVTAYVLIASIATMLTKVALCLTIALLAWRMLHQRPFRRSLTKSVGIAGTILAVGGLLSQGATALAGRATATLLNQNDHSFWPVAGRFDPTWIVFGVVLLLVALAFEYGERLQNDSEGLV
ncbi:MAG TPA: hypothetical protein VHZ81_12805 [Galbitalea sp.]|jgi:hypothetical protein|nr:hypothetical protein [Galbitalea sp.]